MASTAETAGTNISPQTTESAILVGDFLAANPKLSSTELGAPKIMTDRYTNQEWKKQIEETQRKVKVEDGKKYEAPGIGSKEFAETIDHTLLKLDATAAQIDALCAEARTEGFKSVCVRVNWVSRCITNLKGSGVVVACVVGFHEGTQETLAKLEEARAAVEAGASELDVVLNHSILTRHNKAASGHKRDSTADTITWKNTEVNSKASAGTSPASGPYSVHTEEDIPDYSAIYTELASLRSLCPSPTVIKLILETSQLSHPQILAAAHLAAAANMDFIKTSTGFNGPGAKLEDVRLMVAAAEYLSTRTKSNGGSPIRQRKMQVKASGGVRSLETALQMLEAGATRLGTSSGLWIMQESRQKLAEKDTKRPSPPSRLYTDDTVDEY